jgi:hypothetical protein
VVTQAGGNQVGAAHFDIAARYLKPAPRMLAIREGTLFLSIFFLKLQTCASMTLESIEKLKNVLETSSASARSYDYESRREETGNPDQVRPMSALVQRLPGRADRSPHPRAGERIAPTVKRS